MQKTGVVFITTGGAAREFFARQVEAGSYRFLDKFPTTVLDERALTEQYEGCAIKQSKSLKTRLHSLSPYDYTLYLDIDVKVTRPLGEELLTPLERGYDFCLAYAKEYCYGDEATPQTGALLFRKCVENEQMFIEWHTEWAKRRGLDEPVLQQVIARKPRKIAWWNHKVHSRESSALFYHRQGAIRTGQV